jgi:phospholipase C
MLTLLIAATATQAHAAPAFKHIVIIFQENRTPDNLFGSNPKFEPGVDLAINGVNSKGKTIRLTAIPLANCYDLSHAHSAFEADLTQGFDQDPVVASAECPLPPNPQFKYVDNSTGTVQPYFDLAENYGFANRMFQTNQGPSFPAHQFIFGGTSAPKTNSSLFTAENMQNTKYAGCIAQTGGTVALIDRFGSETSHPPIYPCTDHPTLTDLLDAARPHITWRYYAPTPGLIWTAPDAIAHICRPNQAHTQCTGRAWKNGEVVPDNPAQVLTDIASCELQKVSWVIPTKDESDHARSNTGLGPQWVASIVNAIGQQPACTHGETYWNDTAIFIAWDDWGGWFDHVRPFAVNAQPNDPPAWGDGYTYGFRVPLLVVSAYTPAGYVSNGILDFGSILYFIEQNFGLGFIGPGTTRYSNYADYHARGRGKLQDFFGLAQPRGFVAIPTTTPLAYFLHAPRSAEGPDDD